MKTWKYKFAWLDTDALVSFKYLIGLVTLNYLI